MLISRAIRACRHSSEVKELAPTIVAILPLALVSMLLPLWLIIEVTLLGSERGALKATSMVAGMTSVRLLQGVLFALVASGADSSVTEQEAHWLVEAVVLVLGILLLVAGFRLLVGHTDPDDPPPRWMTWVDSMTVGKSFGFGAGLVAINSKSWIFTLGALGTIVEGQLSRGQQIGAYLIFIVLAQALLIAMIAVRVLLPARSSVWLAALSTWLETHSRTISTVVALLFGAIFLVKGVMGLVG